MQWLMDSSQDFEKPGLDFIMQLMDPSPALVNFYTSGTTSKPREIKFTKQQIHTSATNTCRYFNITGNSKLLLCLPAGFVAGRMMIARAMSVGAELIWRRPSLNPLNGDLDVTFAAFTPTQVAEIISSVKSEEYFKKIPTVIIGGGIISTELEARLKDYSNDIFATYGMTETLTHIAVRKIGSDVYHTMYDDLILNADGHGCLRLKLPFIYNDFIQTNDIVQLLSNSTFKFIGRYDHIINSGGLKISPEDLEHRIVESGLLHEGDFYITAVKDSVFGEVPALVVLKGIKVDPDLLSAINGLLNKHHSVKHIVIIDKFEYTGTGKLIRKKIDV